jgi:hypothetical protein
MPTLQIIAAHRREDVHAACRNVFGSSLIDPRPLGGGVSGAQILRFEVRGRSFVLRVEPERIARSDRERGFACMEAAAKAGVAPPVHFADAASGVAIMDFVSGRPLSEHPDGPLGLVRALGGVIAKLQQTPPFPRLGHYPEAVGEMLGRLQQSRATPRDSLTPHLEALARIRAALPWDEATHVSSHNDPNPRNMIFDGQRVWLIDWELAFRNDPLVDLAILATDLADTPELENALLQARFGAPANRSLAARLRVIRLLTRLFYGGIVLESLGETARSSPGSAAPALTPRGFRAAVAEGSLVSGAPETAHAFARMSLAAFIEGVAAPDFDETLKVAGQG